MKLDWRTVNSHLVAGNPREEAALLGEENSLPHHKEVLIVINIV